MIVVRLLGGMGNQLFQYAAARRLALHHGVTLKLDVSALSSDNFRSYSLGHFNVASSFASVNEINEFLGTSFFKRVHRKAQLALPHHRRNVVEEQFFHHDPRVLLASSHTYLIGYWQSEKYFYDCAAQIGQDLTLREPPSPQSEDLATKMKNDTSVSLHIRRGDYVENPRTNQKHGVCSLDYYLRAVDVIKTMVANPRFYVFSDDHQWAERNLNVGFPTSFVKHNRPEVAHEDLFLMSNCKHNIIANSTFSWWGAWLNQNPSKVVIAPQKWFERDQPDSKDLIPDSWARV